MNGLGPHAARTFKLDSCGQILIAIETLQHVPWSPFPSAPRGRRRLSVVLALLVIAGSPVTSVSQVRTPHDFRYPTGAGGERSGSYDAICVACHTPTGGGAGATWASEPVSSQPYTMYSTSNLAAPANDQPSGVSLVCLSCHDGTSGPAVFAGDGHELGAREGAHPVSVVYDDLTKPGFRPGVTVEAGGLKLFSEEGVVRVECPTCHNPHDNETARPFLRVSNTGSRLCLTCHVK